MHNTIMVISEEREDLGMELFYEDYDTIQGKLSADYIGDPLSEDDFSETVQYWFNALEKFGVETSCDAKDKVYSFMLTEDSRKKINEHYMNSIRSIVNDERLIGGDAAYALDLIWETDIGTPVYCNGVWTELRFMLRADINKRYYVCNAYDYHY